MNESVKQALPGVAIGVIALAIIYRLTQSQRGPIVSNALLPSGSTQIPSRDPARIAAFEKLADVALGSQRLEEQSKSIAAQLELGKYRLQEQTAIIGAGLQSALAGQQAGLEAERIRQQGLTNRFNAELADRAYDRALQERALDQTFALARQGQIGQGIGNLLGAILGALRPQQSRSGSSSGGGGGSASRPPNQTPTAPRRRPVIPVPNIGPFTPPFVPDWPEQYVDGMDGFNFPEWPGYEAPYTPLPSFNPPDWFDWFSDTPYTPQGAGDLYIPGIDPAPGGGDWWDWSSDGWNYGEPFYPESGGDTDFWGEYGFWYW